MENARVVHGDLRACNVLVAQDKTVKLADFGLTRIKDFKENRTESK